MKCVKIGYEKWTYSICKNYDNQLFKVLLKLIENLLSKNIRQNYYCNAFRNVKIRMYKL